MIAVDVKISDFDFLQWSSAASQSDGPETRRSGNTLRKEEHGLFRGLCESHLPCLLVNVWVVY